MEATEARVETQKSDEEVVRKAFPEKGHLVRRITNVFGHSFRVNFHDPDQQNRIVQSNFVVVVNGQAIDQTNRN